MTNHTSMSSTTSKQIDPIELQRRIIAEASKKLHLACDKVEEHMWGQRENIELALIGLLAGGNLLLEGPPGTGKTDIVKILTQVVNLRSNRIQGTPDLMPSDIIGSEVINPEFDPNKPISEENPKFTFIKGPIFTQILFVDEINRMSPKTQAALLQAMQENKVTVNGVDYQLPRPFLVVATQNPQEQEGTYPLPEAQKDRFMMKLSVGSVDTEVLERITQEKSTGSLDKFVEFYNRAAAGEDLTKRNKSVDIQIDPALGPNDMIIFNELVGSLIMNDEVNKAIVKLVESTRPQKNETIQNDFKNGAEGARASLSIAKLIRAKTLLDSHKDGRIEPNIEDVKFVAPYVLIDRVTAKNTKIEKDKVLRELAKNI